MPLLRKCRPGADFPLFNCLLRGREQGANVITGMAGRLEKRTERIQQMALQLVNIFRADKTMPLSFLFTC